MYHIVDTFCPGKDKQRLFLMYCMFQNEELESYPEATKIPADIKQVKEGKIDVENIQAGLEHKLFCQNAIRGVVA